MHVFVLVGHAIVVVVTVAATKRCTRDAQRWLVVIRSIEVICESGVLGLGRVGLGGAPALELLCLKLGSLFELLLFGAPILKPVLPSRR
jgi:hypothetical protein